MNPEGLNLKYRMETLNIHIIVEEKNIVKQITLTNIQPIIEKENQEEKGDFNATCLFARDFVDSGYRR